ncbi:uncharacterized protein si:ch211-51h4.2 isoform X2 [Melanotaenia boesemani]|uniref:uncharacterized protein si:ch211-51h4.2 isoform X2 n=1 Tax=Melanotaenia boesemani TaxID=1250792 RepID=UPI001C03A644|nr:uncharacterized protein si:ch211-51h4.2 isoform X2 [Melanotaenia boesemani]
MMATDAEEIRTHTKPFPVPDNSLSALSIKLTRKNQDRHWRLRCIYLQCYFLTIATILGTGILGLPVTIAHAGLVPFLASFLVGFFVQAILIYLFVELLQKCQVVELESLKTGVAECIVMDQVSVENPALTEEEEEDEAENAEADTGLLQPSVLALHDQTEGLQPNLHLLGCLFLSRPMSHAFNCILLFQFISIGISYVLAGSEAYAALLDISHIYVIPVFTLILSLAILLAHTVIQPITSLLTLLKGILLIVTVAVTFAVGSEVGLQSSSDFSQMGKPFLMGTVALGGIVNVMPLLFSQISHNRTQILWFRRAVLGGLTTCTVLNILWCWAVLEIVPQTSLPERRMATNTTTSPTSSSTSARPTSVHPQLFSNISLENSEKAGEIATIPLTKIINEHYRAFSWVAELIQVFIAISVTVSFLVMGSAMKHTLDGLVSSLWSSRLEWMSKAWERNLPNKHHVCSARRHFAVPLPVGDCVFSLTWLLPTYFLFAVTYDVLQTLADVAHYLNLYNHDQEPHTHNWTGSFTATNLSTLT